MGLPNGLSHVPVFEPGAPICKWERRTQLPCRRPSPGLPSAIGNAAPGSQGGVHETSPVRCSILCLLQGEHSTSLLPNLAVTIWRKLHNTVIVRRAVVPTARHFLSVGDTNLNVLPHVHWASQSTVTDVMIKKRNVLHLHVANPSLPPTPRSWEPASSAPAS